MKISAWSPILALVLAACPSDDSPADGTESTGSSSDGSPSSSPPADSSSGPGPGSMTGSTTASEDTESEAESSSGEIPTEPAIHWVGRYDDTDPAAVRMGWSGAGRVFRFDGTGAGVTLDDQAGYHTVVIDGDVQAPLVTTPGAQRYTLAQDLPPGEHTLELYRRTEGSFGSTVVLDVAIDGELRPPPPVTRRMEVIGDSISAGYGNEGTAPCSFSAQTENHFMTYGAIAARSVGAELHTVAWSGKGMVYNYGDDVFEPMPEIYDRTIATEAAAWDFSRQPDVVVINLGTNDFSTDNDPSQEQYVGAYVDFLARLREVYPAAFLLAVAPSLFGPEADLVEGYLLEVVDQRHMAGDLEVAYANVNVEWIGSGCDGHPTVATHEGMAGQLVEALELHLGW